MLKDNYNRYFSYLRLSITDLCNFRCKYCLPDNIKFKHKSYLSVEEIYNLIAVLSELGIKKVRITGGEPTVRKDFISIGKVISSFSSIESLVFTTNGYRLSSIAKSAYNAGFNGVNISLDTLDDVKFSMITNRDYFSKVFEGIFCALDAGLNVKINVVLSDFFSFEDFEDFYSLLKYKNLTIRFIDQMETNSIKRSDHEALRSNYLVKFLKRNNWTVADKKMDFAGPAVVFVNKYFLGKIGVINPYSRLFCSSCNRLRVSAVGDLFLCLFGGRSYPIRLFLDSIDKKSDFKSFLYSKVKLKSYSHSLNDKDFGLMNSFSSIGG